MAVAPSRALMALHTRPYAAVQSREGTLTQLRLLAAQARSDSVRPRSLTALFISCLTGHHGAFAMLEGSSSLRGVILAGTAPAIHFGEQERPAAAQK